MLRILQHTIAGLLIACMVTANMAPLVCPAKPTGLVCLKIDAHDDSLPAEGKEEKTESFKFARTVFSIPRLKVEIPSKRFLEHPRRSKRQVYLPIILPPPKAIA